MPPAVPEKRKRALTESNRTSTHRNASATKPGSPKKPGSSKKPGASKKPGLPKKTDPSNQTEPPGHPRSISNIVDDVFSKASDSFVEKQRHGSTAVDADVRSEIRRHFRPNRKVDEFDEDEVSVEDLLVNNPSDFGAQEDGPGPLFQAVNSSLGDRTFVKKSSPAKKGKTKSAASKSSSSKATKLVRFGHIAFLPVWPEDRADGPILRLPTPIHLGLLRKAGLLLDPPARQHNLEVPYASDQSEITEYLKPLLPIPFQHLEDDNDWLLLTAAGKKLADFGSSAPSGSDFATVVAGQKGAQVIDKIIYIAPSSSFSKRTIKGLKLETVAAYLQADIVPTRRSKRRSNAAEESEMDSDDEDIDGDDARCGGADAEDESDAGAGADDADEDDEDGGEADEEDSADEDSAEEDEEDGADEEEASENVYRPKKRRRVETPNSSSGRAFDDLFPSGDGATAGFIDSDGEPLPIEFSTPGPSHRTYKGKENYAINAPSSSPSVDVGPWADAANYEPKMSFLSFL